MAGNRVEDLEAKVRELEATIDGLTDELVETKERLHALEDETGVEPDVLEGRLTRSETRLQQQQTPEEEQEETTEQAAEDEDVSAEGDTTEEADGEDNADSESGDDIIVA